MIKKRTTLLALGCVIALTAGCGSSVAVKPRAMKHNNQQVIMRIGTGDNVSYQTADNLFEDMLENSTRKQELLFNAMQKAVVKAAYPADDEIRDNVTQEIKDWEEGIREEANSSGVSFTALRKERLTSLGFESVKEYRDELIFNQQKEKLEKRYWSELTDIEKIDENSLSVKIQDYVRDYRPYHIKHILVTLDESSSPHLYEGKITAAEAKKLGTVCQRLATSSFSQVANDQSLNGDYHDNYIKLSGQGVPGDVGLMAKNTSFYNEFKFGAYLFDMNVRNKSKANEIRTEMFEENAELYDDDTLDSSFEANGVFDYNDGIDYIDISECNRLVQVAEKERWEAEDTENKYGLAREARLLPRNVIFNQRFNSHNFGIITGGGSVLVNEEPSTFNSYRARSLATDNIDLKDYTYDYQDAAKNALAGTTYHKPTHYITDSNQSPIFYIRSSKGVHFMVIEKSPFDADAMTYFSSLDKITGTKTFIYNGIETATNDRQYIDAKKDILRGQIQNSVRKEAIDSQATVSNSTNQFFDFELIKYYRKSYTVNFTDPNHQAIYDDYVNRSISNQEATLKEQVASSLISYIRLLEREAEVSGFGNEDYRVPICAAFGNVVNNGTPNYSGKYGSCIYSLKTLVPDNRDVYPTGRNGSAA